jgi:uncharacterized membrane protein
MNYSILKFIVAFLVLDAIYLTSTSGHYSKVVMAIQKSKLVLKMVPTIIVYILLMSGWYLVIYREKDRYTLRENVLKALLYGIVVYGVYDFTNMAVFENWDIKTALMDTMWGGILHGTSTYVSLM